MQVLYKYTLDYSKADLIGLTDSLLEVDFSVWLNSMDVEFIWSQLKSIIGETINMLVPKIKIKSNSSPRWFTPEIRRLLNCVRTLRGRSKHSYPKQTRSIRTSSTKLNINS